MHPLRETIKISGKRERERGARRPPWWPLPRAHLQFVIRHTQRHRACETPISTFFPTLSVSKHLRFIRIAFERHILSLSSPRLSLVHPFSLFFDHLSFHFSCHFSFLACPCFHLLLLSLSPFPLSSSILHPRPRVDWRAFEARAENFEKENQRRGRRDVHRHIQPPLFACITAIYSRGGRDPFTRVRASEKRFENLHEGGTDGGEEGAASTRGESENLRAIAIRARVHCAKFRRKREKARDR